MKRAHRRAHLLAWVILVPSTLAIFALSLYLKQPEPQVTDKELDAILQETE